eukprot:scaffold31570_cov94-Skeletonema_dohrnii-CCMP3373.AAC.2
MYTQDGKGVGRDTAKRLYHLGEAAIGGQPKARHDLGVHEVKRGRIGRAVKHFIIAANLGHDRSTNHKACVVVFHRIKEFFNVGNMTSMRSGIAFSMNEGLSSLHEIGLRE